MKQLDKFRYIIEYKYFGDDEKIRVHCSTKKQIDYYMNNLKNDEYVEFIQIYESSWSMQRTHDTIESDN